jgi:DNA helicase-2/ATP-dependent DNA helicase PcrA
MTTTLKPSMNTDDPWTMNVGDGDPNADDNRYRGRPTPRYEPLDGSPQQEAFWTELLEGTSHILLEARAGTGKSTSCREGMWRLLKRQPRLAIRYCCFNTKVAREFEEKAPPGVQAKTMHSFGNLALAESFRCTVDKDKTFTLILGSEGGPDLPRYVRKTIAKLVGLAKNHGLRPDDPKLESKLAEFIDAYDIETWRREDEAIDWAARILALSASTTSIIDYDDMLWLSVLYPIRFPDVDFLFIDECQDLNPVQHELAERMCSSGRTIIVGDPYQSIYAFRGADSQSIPKLREKLDAKTMPLTVTFRCPRKHVELARQLVPDFESAPGAPDGELIVGTKELIDGARPGDMVLCRSNAPVISACLKQIANLVPAIVRGRAIGDSLLSIVRRVGDPPTIQDFIKAVDRWKAREISRLEAKDGSDDLIEGVVDRALSLEAVASVCESPTEIPSVIDRLFADDDASNRVTFSSVHRAKGSEARRVTYIQIPYSEKRDKARPPQQWERDQRRNLRYVALTRSLESLTLVS